MLCACVAPAEPAEGFGGAATKAEFDTSKRPRVQWVVLEREQDTGDLETDLSETYPGIEVVGFEELMGRARAQHGVVTQTTVPGVQANGHYVLPAFVSFFFVGTVGTSGGTAAATGTLASGFGKAVVGLGLGFLLGQAATEIVTVEPPSHSRVAFETFEVEGHHDELALAASATPPSGADWPETLLLPPLILAAVVLSTADTKQDAPSATADANPSAPKGLRIVFLDLDDATFRAERGNEDKVTSKLFRLAQDAANKAQAATIVHDNTRTISRFVKETSIHGRGGQVSDAYLKTIAKEKIPAVLVFSHEDGGAIQTVQNIVEYYDVFHHVLYGHGVADPLVDPSDDKFTYLGVPLTALGHTQRGIPGMMSSGVVAYSAYLSRTQDCDLEESKQTVQAIATTLARNLESRKGRSFEGIALAPHDLPPEAVFTRQSLLPLAKGTKRARSDLQAILTNAIVIIGGTYLGRDKHDFFETGDRVEGSKMIAAIIYKLYLAHGGADCG